MTAFNGFLRFEEIASIKCSHVTFLQDKVELFVPKSKKDQLLPIAKMPSVYYPVAFLQKYLTMAGEDTSSNNYVFRRVVKYREGFCLNKINKAISYSSMWDIIKDAASK